MASFSFNDHFYAVGVQDPALRCFDIVMHTEHGTTYNAYVLKTTEGAVLFETVKASFFDRFEANIREVCDPATIKYIVVNHTEPDHEGALSKTLALCPNATVLATPTALDFLSQIVNAPFPSRATADNETLRIGNVTLRFMHVPFLHWPDTQYTYIVEDEILVSCDSFGAHYASELICEDRMTDDFIPDARYYFDAIMGPFKSHVRDALARIKNLPIQIIAPGHGPVWRKNYRRILDLYAKWSAEMPVTYEDKPKVGIVYVSAYGYTEEIAHKIVEGIRSVTEADVSFYDMTRSNPDTVSTALQSCQGVLFGTPTLNADALPPVMAQALTLNGITNGGKVAGAFGSYGWSGEGPDMLMARLRLTRQNTVEPALKIRFKPGADDLKAARNYGERFGRKLQETFVRLTSHSGKKTLWKCVVCGEIFESPLPPSHCPACGAGAEAMVPYNEEKIAFHDSMPYTMLIIGGGAAALSAAKAIRKRNDQASIEIITAEKELPYYRPAITKKLATAQTAADNLIEKEHFYADEKITLTCGVRAEEILVTEKNVRCSDGKIRAYDRLLIATGARAYALPLPGHTLEGVFTLRTFDDSARLRSAIGKEPKNVVVIGGGLLGLESAWQLIALGHKVTILEAFPILLPRQLSPEAAALLKPHIRKRAKNIILGAEITSIEGNGTHVTGVKLANGTLVEADAVLFSVGVRSDVELAQKANIKVDRGICVNEFMQSSLPNIYAAGDCAVCNGKFDGLWETALLQGEAAGAAMAGDRTAPYKPEMMPAIFHGFNMQLISIGLVNIDPQDSDVTQYIHRDDVRGNFEQLCFKSGKLLGGILIGDVAKTNLLIEGVKTQMSIEEATEAGLL